MSTELPDISEHFRRLSAVPRKSDAWDGCYTRGLKGTYSIRGRKEWSAHNSCRHVDKFWNGGRSAAAVFRGLPGIGEGLRAGAEGVAVGEHRVDLPPLTGGPAHPDL